MKTVNREQARSLIENGSQTAVIEVLSAENFEKFHLPGARNVPLDDEFEARIQQAVPDKSQQVLLYCFDQECDASPKAAQRMDDLGYEQVCDYAAGKMDWKEAGLPVKS